jgi:HTH-type transcriptional regulator/antitoxin HipB
MSLIVRSPKQLGNIIRRTRRQHSMTQTQLAGLTGLRQELISKIETGHEGAKLSTVFVLFGALGLEIVVEMRTTGALKDIEDIF